MLVRSSLPFVGAAILVIGVPWLYRLSSPQAAKAGATIPAASAKTSNPFPWKSERLPVEVAIPDEGDARNERWELVARLLRVRDLQVYQWPSAYNRAGVAEWQQRHTVEELHKQGYSLQKRNWEVEGWGTMEGFRATKRSDVLSAMWANNGSYLFLYWGHEVE